MGGSRSLRTVLGCYIFLFLSFSLLLGCHGGKKLPSAMPFCHGVLLSHRPRSNVASWPLTSENSSQNKLSLSSCFLGSLVIVMKDTANTLPVGLAFAIKTQPQWKERHGALKGSIFLLSMASCSSTDYGDLDPGRKKVWNVRTTGLGQQATAGQTSLPKSQETFRGKWLQYRLRKQTWHFL